MRRPPGARAWCRSSRPGAQFDRALAIATHIAAQAPLGVQAALASARLARREGPRAALEALMPALPAILQTQDMREAVLAFTQRRQAVFTGR